MPELPQMADPVMDPIKMQIEHARRVVALQNAHRPEDSPEEVVRRAKAYHSFLSGDDA